MVVYLCVPEGQRAGCRSISIKITEAVRGEGSGSRGARSFGSYSAPAGGAVKRGRVVRDDGRMPGVRLLEQLGALIGRWETVLVAGDGKFAESRPILQSHPAALPDAPPELTKLVFAA